MKNFEALENKLNIATSLIEELVIDDYEINLPETSVVTNLPALTIEESTDQVFSIETLKSDFVMIRQSLMKLVSTGQRMLDSVSVLDPSDIKAATIMAIAQMQTSVGSHIELLVKVYSEMSKIELTRSKSKASKTESNPVNNGTVINNNQTIFAGSTSDLLTFMKENQNT